MTFSEDIVWQVWSKGIVIGGNDALLWRKDEFGAWILRSHYGRRDSEYGWEIDHIKPVSEGGTDALSNLRPMHWENIARKTNGTFDRNINDESYPDIEYVLNN
jgi:HNH endonuclease